MLTEPVTCSTCGAVSVNGGTIHCNTCFERAQLGIGEGTTRPHGSPEQCPTYYDGCNCTVEALVHNIERARKAEARITELEKERADILRLAGECYTPVSLAAHVGSTRWDWEQAHKLLDAAGVPDNLTLGDRIQALLNR